MSKIEELLAKYNGNLFDAIQFDEWYKAKISRNEIITYVDYMAWVCSVCNNVMVKADKLRKLHRKFRGMKNRPPF